VTLAEVIDCLREAIEVGREIGLPVAEAEELLATAEKRSGFTGESFVMALVGGTGVGKSTLLNALAGTVISKASPLRPTTSAAHAWVSEEHVEELQPLLDWLEVGQVSTHADERLENVAIVDLPDFDSIAHDHRQTVDQVLPRVDMALWVVDPEKYDDERLHRYLRPKGPDSPQLHVVLNKIDQLSATDVEAVASDISRLLTGAGFDDVQVHPLSAATGAGLGTLKDWLSSNGDAKRVIAERLRADAEMEITRLGEAAGIDPTGPADHLIGGPALSGYVDDAVGSALDIVDPRGVAAQLRRQVQDSGRIAAGSPLGRIGTMIRSLMGKKRREADPVRYLLNWRSRGDLGRVTNPVRDAYMEATSSLDPSARATILTRLSPDQIRTTLTSSVDAVTGGIARDLRARPHPLLWRLLAPLQWVATGGLLVASIWYLTILIGPADIPVGTIEVPIVGPMPALLVLLLGSASLSLLVAAIVNVQASFSSRQRGREIQREIRDRIETELRSSAFGPLANLESQRQELASVVSRISRRAPVEG